MKVKLITKMVNFILLLIFFCLSMHYCACAQSMAAVYDFGSSIAAITAYDKGFAILSGEDIWLYDDNADSPTLLLTQKDVTILSLFTNDNGMLYALVGADEGYDVYALDEEEKQLFKIYHVAIQSKPAELRQVFWHEGKMIMEFEGDAIYQSNIFFVDIDHNTIQEVRNCNIVNLTAYLDNTLLGLKLTNEKNGYILTSFDIDTKHTKEVCELQERPEALWFDKLTKQIIIFIAPNANILSMTGESITQRYLPVSHISESRKGAISKTHILVLTDDNKLLVLDLEEEQKNDALRITRFNEDGAETKRFRHSHPDIPVNSVNMGYTLTPAMISQMIIGNDNETDIYMVRSFEIGYSALLNKGYCADLSGSSELSARIMSMPSNLASAVMRNEQVFGVPVDMEFDIWTTLACNAETLVDSGLELQDFPENMMDLLDRLLEWYEDGTLYDVRLFHFSASRQPFVAAWFLLNNYTYYSSANSDWIDYDTQTYKALFEKCDKLIAELKKHTEISDASPYLFDYVTSDEILSGGESDERLIIPLTPEQGMSLRYPATITVAVLNPLSQNKALALTYLNALINELPASIRLYFWPDAAEPIEAAEYLERRRIAEDEIGHLESLLQTNEMEPEARNEIKAKLSEQRNWIELIEREDRWEVSPDTIADYQKIVDDVFVPESSINELLDEQTVDAVRQYAAGTMNLRDFIQYTIRKANLMHLE